MKKTMRSLLICLLTAVLLLGDVVPALAGSGYSGYTTAEEISLNRWDGENYTVRTPSGEGKVLYVEGRTVSPTKMFLIRVVSMSGGSVINTFVRPDSSGEFAVAINTTSGNKTYPTATKGTVVKGETGGATNTRCFETMPGYLAVPTMSEATYRVIITRATTDAQANAVYDGNWGDEDNTLSGALGYACKEIVVVNSGNKLSVANYSDIRNHNASVRAENGALTMGTDAYEQYTDTYLKDIEWAMDTTGTTHPMLPEKVAFIKSVADQITAPASTDYDKVRLIYEYIADNFYYDYYAYKNDNKRQYCNPYDNLYRFVNQVDGPNSSNGRVATVCNGFAAMVIAMARAEGIPARMARGYHIDTGSDIWQDEMQFTTKITHWWSEVYVDGRWMVVDANSGCQNTWRRSGWTDTSDDAWVTGDVRSYAGFDMTDAAVANNYYYNGLYNEYRELMPPRITSVDTSTGNVIIRWEAVEGADTYYVYRGTSDGALSYLGAAKSTTPTEFVSRTEDPEVTYYYRVRGVKGSTEGSWSNLFTAVVSQEEWNNRSKVAIIDHPQSVTAAPGESVTFTVVAEGDGLTYRWQVCAPGEDSWNDSGADGATTDTIRVNATLARNGQKYRCIVKDTYGNKATSDEAMLTVKTNPLRITQQPQSVTAAPGESVSFTVVAEGDGLTYRWQVCAPGEDSWVDSGADGATTDTIHVTATLARSGQRYRCIVKDASGDKVTSEPAMLVVAVSAPVITAQPQDVTAPIGETVSFTVAATGSSLAYRWQYYTGSAWADSGMTGSRTNTLSVPVTAARNGQQYRCIVTGSGGGEAISDAASLYVKTVITTQPAAVSASVGATAKFTVKASGVGLTYQWQYYTGSKWSNSGMTGASTATLSVPVTAARNGQKYRCVITDANGVTTTSSSAVLTVKTKITAQPTGVKASVGETAKFTVSASGAGLKYQWQYYTGSKWANSGMTGNKTATLSVPVTAARNGQKYRCVITDANGVVTESSAAALTVKTKITAQPAGVSAPVGDTAKFTVVAAGAGLKYQWQYYTGSTWTNSGMTGNKTATLSVPVTAARNGQKYRCVITDANGVTTTSSSASLKVTIKITGQPANVTVSAGTTVQFTVKATGAGLKYQWYYRTSSTDTWKSSGATGCKTATLSIDATKSRNGYQYRCVITDANGKKVESQSATLTVK